MKDKTYRIDIELSDRVRQKTIEYIRNNGVIISEAKMLNAILAAGLETAKDKDVCLYLGLCEKEIS